MVVGVTYAPPGSASFVNYTGSTMLGSSVSLSNSFTNDTTITGSAEFDLPKIPGVFDGSVTVEASAEFEQQWDNSSSFAVNTTTEHSTQAPGPSDSSRGIDHDADIIWVWLNPRARFVVNSPTDFQWKGFAFDFHDRAWEMDVVGINVAYLNGHAAMPPNVAAPLARSWAPPIQCNVATDPECGPDGTKSPALNAADFAEILKADPFADPAYLVNVPVGARCTTDHRFCRTSNPNLQYMPPPPGVQPITQTITLKHEATDTAGQGFTGTTKVGLSAEISAGGDDDSKAVLNSIKAKLKVEDQITFTSAFSSEDSHEVDQTALVSITGPTTADNYQGPVRLNVFQDTLYGTFMFSYVIDPIFSIAVGPNSLGVMQGQCVTYTVSTTAPAGFGAAINLSVTGLPANASATFAPAAINGSGMSLMSVCAAPSTPAGTSTLTVNGVYGLEVESIVATLVVTAPPPPPDFALSVTPSSQSKVAGTTAIYQVSATAISGFSGNVALSLSGMPPGATVLFSPTSIPMGGTATMYVSTASSTKTGPYYMNVSGVSGGVSHSAPVILGVTAPPPPPGCTKPSPTCPIDK